jgi:hypothetical protein
MATETGCRTASASREDGTMSDQDRSRSDSLGGAPETGGTDDESRRRCEQERDALTAKETADCAGTDLADSYENEEDGGS